jgi:hypothetical protein
MAQWMPSIVVWVPMLVGDDLPSAKDASEQILGPSTPQFWDGGQRLGKKVAASLGAPGWTAWDIYLFYPPGAEWTANGLPKPEAALIQSNGVVLGLQGTLPPVADQSSLPERLHDCAVVVGEQSDLEGLLAEVTNVFVKRHPHPRVTGS